MKQWLNAINVNILMVKCNECKHFQWLNAMNVNILMVKCNKCKHFNV